MTMRKTLAAMLMLVACAGVGSAQSLEVHLTRSEPGGVLRAGALYVATPISRWLYFDMAIEPFVNSALRPHRDIYLVGPDGTRIPQPDLGTIRANREEILGLFGAISASDAAAVFPISRQFSTKCGNDPATDTQGRETCPRHALWKFEAEPVGRVMTLRRGTVVLTEPLFEAPAGGWAAGDYVLTIDGPGESVTQLPVRIG